MMVNAHAAAKASESPKLSSVAAMEPMRMENSSHERNVRSVASCTLGSTRTGTWMPSCCVRVIFPKQMYCQLTLALGGLESLHFSSLFPARHAECEASITDISRRRLWNNGDNCVKNCASKVGRCSLGPLSGIAKASCPLGGFEVVIFIIAIRVVDGVIVVSRTSGSDTLLNVQHIGVVAVG